MAAQQMVKVRVKHGRYLERDLENPQAEPTVHTAGAVVDIEKGLQERNTDQFELIVDQQTQAVAEDKKEDKKEDE